MTQMTDPHFTEARLRTPRAAAIAGILFALLFTISIVLIRLSVPETTTEFGTWLDAQAGTVRFALGLMPYAGLAFLWFIGVIRDRIGAHEDRLLATVLLGSGLLFVAMVFISSALAGAMLISYANAPQQLIDSGVYAYGRAVMYQITNIYAIRMAGVFMVSLGTIALRTGVMPRWLVILTYGLALLLLLIISLSLWVVLIFPAWVFVISIAILVWNYRRTSGDTHIQTAT
jgi:hypothetical protein